jgi:hypothetical protein
LGDAGRVASPQAHEARVDLKEGWQYEPKIPVEGGKALRPDTGTPMRTPDPDKRFYLELKPDTPTGRIAGARAARRYQEASGQKVRVIYYNPKDYR